MECADLAEDIAGGEEESCPGEYARYFPAFVATLNVSLGRECWRDLLTCIARHE